MTQDKHIIQLPTPLHDRTAEQSRSNAWTSWNGFTVPLAFGPVSEEARAIARRAGLADYSPQPIITCAGPDAASQLDRLLTWPVSGMGEGEVRSALMCAADGHVIDRCTIARTEPQEFLVICDSAVGARLTDISAGQGMEVSQSDEALIGVVGAARDQVLTVTGLNAMTGADGFVQNLSVRGIDVMVIDLPDQQTTLIRAGRDDAGLMWNRFMKKQSDTGVMPVGLAALERYRVDQGIPRAGYEFSAANKARSVALQAYPSELGWAGLVSQDGRAFAGAAALSSNPGTRRLVRIEIPRAFDLTGARLVQGDQGLGRVTSSYMAPEHSLARGLALIDNPAESGPVKVETGNGILTPEIIFLN